MKEFSFSSSCYRFITQLQPGDELAIVTFSNTARINLEPTRVSQTNKEGLHGRVPGRASNSNTSSSFSEDCPIPPPVASSSQRSSSALNFALYC